MTWHGWVHGIHPKSRLPSEREPRIVRVAIMALMLSSRSRPVVETYGMHIRTVAHGVGLANVHVGRGVGEGGAWKTE